MNEQSSYDRTRERLEEIVAQVKAKDVPLEKSLELYEEALRLGNRCAEMIDRTDFSAEELERAGARENLDAEEADEGGEPDKSDKSDKADKSDEPDESDESGESVAAKPLDDEPTSADGQGDSKSESV